MSEAKAVPAEDVAIDLATPDKAIKSYWAVRDAVRKRHDELFEQRLDRYRAAEAQLSAVTDGALTRSFASDIGVRETFSRDIIDVKVESDSRAVVVAAIKNTTPVPPGAELTDFDKERRRDGERYRYILEKEQNGWRVAEIWEWETYPTPEWQKSRPGDGKPIVSSLTYNGM